MSEFVADAIPLLSTAGLLEQLRRGDDSAWTRFANRYAPVAYAFSRRRSASPPIAQQTVQRVFGDIHRELESSRFVESDASALEWVLNLADQHLTESAVDRTLDHGTGESPSHHDATMIVTREPRAGGEEGADDYSLSLAILVQQVLQELRADFPSESLSIFRRVVVDGESASTVAESLTLPIGTVYRTVHEVLQRLRMELKK